MQLPDYDEDSPPAKGLFDASQRAEALYAKGLSPANVEVRLMDEGFSEEDAATAAADMTPAVEVERQREDKYAHDILWMNGIDIKAELTLPWTAMPEQPSGSIDSSGIEYKSKRWSRVNWRLCIMAIVWFAVAAWLPAIIDSAIIVGG